MVRYRLYDRYEDRILNQQQQSMFMISLDGHLYTLRYYDPVKVLDDRYQLRERSGVYNKQRQELIEGSVVIKCIIGCVNIEYGLVYRDRQQDKLMIKWLDQNETQRKVDIKLLKNQNFQISKNKRVWVMP